VEAHAHICALLSLSNGHGNLVWFINSLALARSEPVPPRCGCIYRVSVGYKWKLWSLLHTNDIISFAPFSHAHGHIYR